MINRKELKNFIIYFFFKKNLHKNIFFYLRLIAVKILFIFFSKFLVFYPNNIKKLAKNIRITKRNKINYPKQEVPHGPKKIILINRVIKINDVMWNFNFCDKEMTLSLNRWNWLLLSLTEEVSPPSMEWGIFMIRSYLSKQTPLPKGIRSESYSVGERISNALLFFREKTGIWDNYPIDIKLSIQVMADHLSKNIEFYPEDMSGNHVLNNARAILMSGHSLNNLNLINLGREILSQFLPKLFDEDGFLREGSSHYQFLTTRWLLEIRMISEDKDDKMTLEILNKQLTEILNACNFFLIKDDRNLLNIPIIGDISPDCSIEWIIELFNSPLSDLNNKFKPRKTNRGWSKLFTNWKPSNNFKWRVIETKIYNNRKSNSIWQKHIFENWTLFSHNEVSKGLPIASHAHNDFGSFVLFHRGNEIIIDPGRRDYTKKTYIDDFVMSKSHSIINLNGLPPVITKNEKFFPIDYKKAEFETKIYKANNFTKFEFEHTGFSRINATKKIHTRIFELYKDKLIIEDILDGSGAYILEYFLHLPSPIMKSKISLKKSMNFKNLFKLLNIELDICIINLSDNNNLDYKTVNPKLGSRSRNYGLEESSIIVQGKDDIVLPTKIRYTLKVLSKKEILTEEDSS